MKQAAYSMMFPYPRNTPVLGTLEGALSKVTNRTLDSLLPFDLDN